MAYWHLHSSKLGKTRKARRDAQAKRDFQRGLDALGKLRDDQITHVEHLLRSWCCRDGNSLSAANAHMGVCRRAIARTLRDHP